MTKKNKKEDEKCEALRANGTLYSNADEVKDDCFINNKFFDANDVLQVKYEMLRRVAKDGWTVSKAVDVFGFSRPSYYEAHAGFESRGLQGLLPKRRGPKEPHKLSEKILSFIAELLEREHDINPDEVTQRVLQYFSVCVHPRSIGRALDMRKKKKERANG